jgi:hypothetical protein
MMSAFREPATGSNGESTRPRAGVNDTGRCYLVRRPVEHRRDDRWGRVRLTEATTLLPVSDTTVRLTEGIASTGDHLSKITKRDSYPLGFPSETAFLIRPAVDRFSTELKSSTDDGVKGIEGK